MTDQKNENIDENSKEQKLTEQSVDEKNNIKTPEDSSQEVIVDVVDSSDSDSDTSSVEEEALVSKKPLKDFTKPAPRNRSGHKSGDNKDSAASEMMEQVISINRITKVTKGGKKLSFSALVVVGDTMGNVGYALCKAREVATAIKKSIAVAKKNMIKVPMRGTTIPHEIIGQCSGSRVLLKPASEGTGVIASGPVRAVCDGAGIHNILTKCHRSNNPINVVKAVIDGLSRLKSANKGK